MTDAPYLLFSAPHAFLPHRDVLFEGFETACVEAWTADRLPSADRFRFWVPNPGQHFVIDDEILKQFPTLEAISTPSTGTNHIDRDDCARHGVSVHSLLDDRVSLDAISASAEFTFLHALNALRRIDVGLVAVRAGEWRDDENRFRGRELQDRRVGLVGLGRIGSRLSRYFAAFDCPVSAYDPYATSLSGVRLLDTLLELFETSDVVAVCCALTEETRGMVGAEHVLALPENAVLVNTSRGEILREAEIAGALQRRRDVALAADVITGEVDGSFISSPLLAAAHNGQVLVTPHIAGATFESQFKAAKAATDLLRERYLA